MLPFDFNNDGAFNSKRYYFNIQKKLFSHFFGKFFHPIETSFYMLHAGDESSSECSDRHQRQILGRLPHRHPPVILQKASDPFNAVTI